MTAHWRLFLKVTLPLSALNLINQASRTVMAIIGPVLAEEFSFSASELGLLAACMFAAYAVVQLPEGVALDVIGPRRVQAALSLVAAAGFALFALADGLAGFAVARVLLGIGVSAGLMAVLKANTQWFAPAQVANMSGIAGVIGALGSVLTTTPAQAALPTLGWRGVLWLLCAFSCAAAVWIFASVPDKRREGARPSLKAELAVMAAICRSRVFWRYGPAVAMLAVMNFTYLGLWAGPWLRDVAGYEGQARANTLLLYTLGTMLGVTLIGAATSRMQARGYSTIAVLLWCHAGLLAAQVVLALQPGGAAVPAAWVLFAFCAAGSTPGYVIVGQMFPREQMGRVSTAANTLTLIGAFVLQTVIGALLDLWPRTTDGGWDPRGYSVALALSVVIQIVVVLRLIRSRRYEPSSHS
ncbi:MAG TPA: MFS transporter [Ktedonobacterales bacterium]|nr:MFS transporter [Ktedonobacterales bacterium]